MTRICPLAAAATARTTAPWRCRWPRRDRGRNRIRRQACRRRSPALIILVPGPQSRLLFLRCLLRFPDYPACSRAYIALLRVVRLRSRIRSVPAPDAVLRRENPTKHPIQNLRPVLSGGLLRLLVRKRVCPLLCPRRFLSAAGLLSSAVPPRRKAVPRGGSVARS